MHDLLRGQVVVQPPGLPNQLWISGQHFAHDLTALSRHNIRAVCSVGSAPFNFPAHIRHLYLQLEDSPDEDITGVWGQAFDFIEESRKQGNVLVHCVMGVSRSASVVVYYLMRRHGWGLAESMEQLKGVRAVVRPNVGFYGQLQGAEKGLALGKLGARF